MAATATYCCECDNKVARTQDVQINAAESAGQAPMTKEGTCATCKTSTIVVYYET